MRALRHASGTDDAPMLLIHSERDFVPVTHAHDLERAERRKGAPARQIAVRTEPGGAHGGPLLWRDSVTRAVLRWSEARG